MITLHAKDISYSHRYIQNTLNVRFDNLPKVDNDVELDKYGDKFLAINLIIRAYLDAEFGARTFDAVLETNLEEDLSDGSMQFKSVRIVVYSKNSPSNLNALYERIWEFVRNLFYGAFSQIMEI